MSLPLPNLDDRTYADLVEEARSLIPIECPEWTDHNPSDTGIILIELFAWLTEMVLYRVNRIPDQNFETFLKLLNGSQWQLEGDLQAAIRETVLDLRKRYRAVSGEDFEQLVLDDWQKIQAAKNSDVQSIVRARCLPNRNLNLLDRSTRQNSAAGHISLVILPQKPTSWLTFDGQDDFVSFSKPFKWGKTYTIEGWFKSNSKESQTIFAAVQVGSDSHHYLLIELTQGGRLRYLHRVPPSSGDGSNWERNNIYSKEGKNYADGHWHHFAVVKGENRAELLVDDDAPQGRNNDTSYEQDTNLVLGRIAPSRAERHFNGQIAEIRIWNRDLTQETIRRNRQFQFKGNEEGLLGYWTLNNTFQDQTSNQNHGILNGSQWQKIRASTLPQPPEALCTTLRQWLDERRLLTTRLHVVEPNYVPLKLKAQLFLEDGANPGEIRNQVLSEVKVFFHPLKSGRYWEGKGWLFGRNVYVSELYQLLDGIPGVDYVQGVTVEVSGVATTTELKEEGKAGSNQLTVNQTTGFAKGDIIRIDLSSSDPEYHTIAEVSGEQITLEQPLDSSPKVGTKVFLQSGRECIANKSLTSIILDDYELVAVDVDENSFTIMERLGAAWRQTTNLAK